MYIKLSLPSKSIRLLTALPSMVSVSTAQTPGLDMVAVSSPLSTRGNPPRLAAGPLIAQSKSWTDALAGLNIAAADRRPMVRAAALRYFILVLL